MCQRGHWRSFGCVRIQGDHFVSQQCTECYENRFLYARDIAVVGIDDAQEQVTDDEDPGVWSDPDPDRSDDPKGW